MKIPTNLTALSQDAIVELYELDTSTAHHNDGTPVVNGDIFRWTPGTIGDEVPSFGGVQYTPFPIIGEGYEWSGQGKAPQPTLSMLNLGGLIVGLNLTYDDLTGATVTRLRTYKKHLDGQSEADPNTHFEPDIFAINRKANEDKTSVQFELATPLEQVGKSVPATVVMRNNCRLTYRQFINGKWIYGTCPYVADAMFNGNDDPVVDSSNDVCSHRLSGCIVRFGERAKLPIYCFPGVGLGT